MKDHRTLSTADKLFGGGCGITQRDLVKREDWVKLDVDPASSRPYEDAEMDAVSLNSCFFRVRSNPDLSLHLAAAL